MAGCEVRDVKYGQCRGTVETFISTFIEERSLSSVCGRNVVLYQLTETQYKLNRNEKTRTDPTLPQCDYATANKTNFDKHLAKHTANHAIH
jgi:hypothetical protein